MTGCKPFVIELEGDINEALDAARGIAQKNDIILTGDNTNGSFDTGNTKGTYHIDQDKMTITITSKLYKSYCGNLQDILTDLFTGNDSRDYKKIFGFVDLGRF